MNAELMELYWDLNDIKKRVDWLEIPSDSLTRIRTQVEALQKCAEVTFNYVEELYQEQKQ